MFIGRFSGRFLCAFCTISRRIVESFCAFCRKKKISKKRLTKSGGGCIIGADGEQKHTANKTAVFKHGGIFRRFL